MKIKKKWKFEQSHVGKILVSITHSWIQVNIVLHANSTISSVWHQGCALIPPYPCLLEQKYKEKEKGGGGVGEEKEQKSGTKGEKKKEKKRKGKTEDDKKWVRYRRYHHNHTWNQP